MRASIKGEERDGRPPGFWLLCMLTIFTIWVVWWHHLVENWNTSTAILVGLIQIQKSLPEPRNVNLTVKNDVSQKKKKLGGERIKSNSFNICVIPRFFQSFNKEYRWCRGLPLTSYRCLWAASMTQRPGGSRSLGKDNKFELFQNWNWDFSLFCDNSWHTSSVFMWDTQMVYQMCSLFSTLTSYYKNGTMVLQQIGSRRRYSSFYDLGNCYKLYFSFCR